MERFSAATVALATGYSASSISAWGNRYRDGVKGGLTVLDVIDFLKSPKKNREAGKADEAAAERLRVALEVMGALTPELELKG